MADQGNQKDMKLSPEELPEGWVLDTMVKADGTEVMCYHCPPTDQRFYTYQDLMRYVNYAKRAKVSVYADNFWENLGKKDSFGAMKSKGQSSNPLEGIKIRKNIKPKTNPSK